MEQKLVRKFVSPELICPYPKATQRKQKNCKNKGKAAVLISTPYKDELDVSIEAKIQKQNNTITVKLESKEVEKAKRQVCAKEEKEKKVKRQVIVKGEKEVDVKFLRERAVQTTATQMRIPFAFSVNIPLQTAKKGMAG